MSKIDHTRLVFFIICIAYIAQNILQITSLSDAFSPDSLSFYQFSGYRQPLYGGWMHLTFGLLGSWSAVKILQLMLFSFVAVTLAFELYATSNRGKYCAITWVIALFILNRCGLTSYVTSLISEGLFYSLLLLVSYLALRWFKTEKLPNLVALVFICVLASQLKTAFIPVLIAVCILLIFWLVWSQRLGDQMNRSWLLVLMLGLIIPAMALPSILGKDFLNLSTEKERFGFVILPRISSLPTPHPLLEELSDWSEMTASWRATSKNLGVLASTQFDAQLQEATRYYLYTSELAPIVNQETTQTARRRWHNGDGYQQAGELALKWIKHSPKEYLIESSKHLFGLLVAAPLMIQSEREQVSKAFEKISPRTWEKVELNKAYPLGDLSVNISSATTLLYLAIRFTALIYLILCSYILIKVFKQFWQREMPKKSAIVISLSFLLVTALSLAPAFTVFPEIRYVLANLLIMFFGLLCYISLLNVPWQKQARH